MSAATTPPAPTTTETHEAALTNSATRAADDMPALVDTLRTVNPVLASQIEGKAAVASATLWGHLALAVIGVGVMKYSLTWSTEFQQTVAGCVVIGAQLAWGLVATVLEKAPITGLFTKAAPPGAVTTTSTTTAVPHPVTIPAPLPVHVVAPPPVVLTAMPVAQAGVQT